MKDINYSLCGILDPNWKGKLGSGVSWIWERLIKSITCVIYVVRSHLVTTALRLLPLSKYSVSMCKFSGIFK